MVGGSLGTTPGAFTATEVVLKLQQGGAISHSSSWRSLASAATSFQKLHVPSSLTTSLHVLSNAAEEEVTSVTVGYLEPLPCSRHLKARPGSAAEHPPICLFIHPFIHPFIPPAARGPAPALYKDLMQPNHLPGRWDQGCNTQQQVPQMRSQPTQRPRKQRAKKQQHNPPISVITAPALTCFFSKAQSALVKLKVWYL